MVSSSLVSSLFSSSLSESFIGQVIKHKASFKKIKLVFFIYITPLTLLHMFSRKLRLIHLAVYYYLTLSVNLILQDMFAAGTNTTHRVLEWAMTELLRHPNAMKKLQSEVRNVKGDKSHIITEDDIDHMPYLKAVLKETLRLHPPVPLLMPRESMQDVKLFGHHIGAETQVTVNAWAIARDPVHWENPQEFQPERFLNSSMDYKGHDFQLIPFGAGRRGCPRTQFAMALNELVIASIVFHFDWSLPDGQQPKDLDMSESVGLTANKKIPLFGVALPYNK